MSIISSPNWAQHFVNLKPESGSNPISFRKVRPDLQLWGTVNRGSKTLLYRYRIWEHYRFKSMWCWPILVSSYLRVIIVAFTSICIDCTRNIFGRNNYFYILSDKQTNADNGQSLCAKLDSSLVESMNNETRKDLIEYSIRRHISSGLFHVPLF